VPLRSAGTLSPPDNVPRNYASCCVLKCPASASWRPFPLMRGCYPPLKTDDGLGSLPAPSACENSNLWG